MQKVFKRVFYKTLENLLSNSYNRMDILKKRRNFNMQFFGEAVNVLQTLVIALGAGLCVWGGINLMEGYGNDNPGAKSQGIKQVIRILRW